MDPALWHNPIGLGVLGVGLLFFSGYFLQLAANVCGADQPTFRKAVLIALLTGTACFFTYDLSGYGILMVSRDQITNLNLPDHFSYGQWLREPLELKWQVLGLLPIVRYLPVLFAVCLASIVYVLVFKVHYRVSMVIFLLQWTLSLVSLAVLSFALTNVLGVLPQPGKSPPDHQPVAAAGPLKKALDQSGEAVGPTLDRLKQFASSMGKALDPYTRPIQDATRPYTTYLPVVVQQFLDEGGWALVLLALAIVAFYWLRSLYRRLRRLLFGKRRKKRKPKESPLAIELRFVGDALTELGPVQAVVRDRAVRLRLVVMAPGVSYVGALLPEMAEGLLDYVKPGLADLLEYDTPRVVVWPRLASEEQFLKLFFKNVEIPEERGRRSRWILMGGTIRLGRQKVHLGLGVHADSSSLLREIRVEKENWEPVLSLQSTKELV